MKTRLIATALGAFAVLGLSTATATAAKLEKVDMVREGIDLAPIVVKANANGYTGYETQTHKYMLRVFAKGKGGNHVYWVGVSSNEHAHPLEAGHTWFFKQGAPRGDDGWGVYKKSLDVLIGVDKTAWVFSPRKACTAKMNTEMAKGRSKADVLKREWKTTATAALYFFAAADSKSRNKNGSHTFTSVEARKKGMAYPVAVVCRKGL